MSLIELETLPIDHGYILEIYLNNPSTRNSMTWEMGEFFEKEIKRICSENPLPRAVILSGRNGVFCAGGDLNLLRSFAEKSYEQNFQDMKKFYNFFLSIRKLPCPVICAAVGHAVGAGLSLAFACDIRIFSDEGKYSFNFVSLGIHPGMGSSYTSVELLGKSKAIELLFLGKTLNGKEAKEYGICLESYPKDLVLEKSREVARELSKKAPLALQELKKNIYSEEELNLALEKEAASQARNFLSKDFQETIESILHKREPKFKGI